MSDLEDNRHREKEQRKKRRPTNRLVHKRQYRSHQRAGQSRSRSREANRRERSHEPSSVPNENQDSEFSSFNQPPSSLAGEQGGIPLENSLNQEYSSYLRVVFIDFFQKLKLGKGLVFSPQQRKKMAKEELKKYKNDPSYKMLEWKGQSQWQELTEKQKIHRIVEDSLGYLAEEPRFNLKEIFLGSSYLFADEVTEELYQLMADITKIITTSETGQHEQRVKELMREVTLHNGRFVYFSFSFSRLFQVNLEEHSKIGVYEEMGLEIMKLLKQKF